MSSIRNYVDLDLAECAFGAKKNGFPGGVYAAPCEEEREVFLRFLEYLLERCIQAKMEDPASFYSPGILLTDEEVQTYYEEDPALRPRLTFQKPLAEEVQAFLEYLGKRQDATEAISFLPIRKLQKDFALSFFELLAILLPLGLSCNINLRNIYAYLANDAALKHPTVGLLYTLYGMVCQDVDMSLLQALCRPDEKMAVCFLAFPERDRQSYTLMDMPLVLRPQMQQYLLSRDGLAAPPAIPFCSYERGIAEKVQVFSETLSKLPKQREQALLYIESREPSDAVQLLSEWGVWNEQAEGGEKRGVWNLYAQRLVSVLDRKGKADAAESYAASLSPLLSYLRLYGGVLCVSMPETEKETLHSAYFCLLAFLRKHLPLQPIFLCGAEKIPAWILMLSLGISVVRLPFPDVEKRQELWEYFLESGETQQLSVSTDVCVADLADCYELSFTKIHHVVSRAKQRVRWEGRSEIRLSDLREHLFALSEAGFRSLASYIPASYTWEDLEISEGQRNVLKMACSRFRHRGRIEKRLGLSAGGAYGNGVSVLLCGPPGTGKTMAAQVVSRELQLPLYRVDVSQIFSKYVGETQKNLGEIFLQAAKTNIVLFFDEADALFAKRTEVTDANDKYANAETAYLLQKMEAHRGMTLLATNLFQNFDTAYVRRLTHVVRFDRPDAQTRCALWNSILPKSMEKTPDLNLDFFGETFELSGSSIKSVLYSAMYLAGAEGRPLSNRDIVVALRCELEKTGLMLNPAQFGQYAAFLYM